LNVMMKKLDRYIVQQLGGMTLIVAAALLAIYSFVVFVSRVDEVGKGDFGATQLVLYTLLLAPGSLYLLMPLIAMLGTMMCFGQFARTGEWIAMRAAGISMLRLGAATLAAGMLLGALTFVLGDWIAPAGERAADDLRDRARGTAGGDALWLREGPSFVRIDHLRAEDRIEGVVIYHLGTDGRIDEALHAARGQYIDQHWRLEDVSETRFVSGGTEASTEASLEWQGGLDPAVLKLYLLEADSLSMRGLLRLVDYLHSNQLDDRKYTLILWRKLLEPITVWVLMLFAIPFAASRHRDTGMGQRLLLGAMVGIGFYLVNKVIMSYGALYHWPAPMAAGAPTFVLGSYALWRLRSER